MKNKLDIDLQNMTNIEKFALISKLDYEITKAVFNGHKSVFGDEFQEHRDIILKLRQELFPQSVWALGTKQD
jgi:low affinity Fe/Cu permease